MIPRLLRHSGWNLAGQAVPMLMGLVSIPILIRAIGDGRFGFLSIGWMLIGYFGVLDLGIGRALTHGVAKRMARDPKASIADLAWTGLAALALLGAVGGLLLAACSPWLVHTFMRLSGELRAEALPALMMLSAAVPFVLLSAGLSGILVARQEFRALSLAQMPMGVLLFAGPLVVVPFSVALPYVILPLLLVRAAHSAVLFAVCTRRVEGFLRPTVSRATLRELLAFGSWMTVSNVVSPIMVNMDRLFIGSLLTVSAVTYYVTPFELTSKLLMISSAIAGVSFPEFSRLAKLGDRDAARRYLVRSLALVLALLAPAALVAGVFAHPILRWWISPALADRSAPLMQILAVGMVVNGASAVAFVHIQGTGRSDLTAKFHLLELACYVPALLVMIRWLGLTGVAVAWVLRVLLDAGLLFRYSWTQLARAPGSASEEPVAEAAARAGSR